MRLGSVRLGGEFILGVHDAPSKARHAHAVNSSNREKPKCIYFDASDDFDRRFEISCSEATSRNEGNF